MAGGKFMKNKLIYYVSILLIVLYLNCNMKLIDNNMNETKEVVIERDSLGRIIKTKAEFLYFEYDTLGRRIGQYGNNMLPDDSTNYRFVIDFSDETKMVVKEYYFEDNNIECKISDTTDYYLRIFHIKDFQFTTYEFYNPIKNEANIVIDRLLVDKGVVKNNYWYHELPEYLK